MGKLEELKKKLSTLKKTKKLLDLETKEESEENTTSDVEEVKDMTWGIGKGTPALQLPALMFIIMKRYSPSGPPSVLDSIAVTVNMHMFKELADVARNIAMSSVDRYEGGLGLSYDIPVAEIVPVPPKDSKNTHIEVIM